MLLHNAVPLQYLCSVSVKEYRQKCDTYQVINMFRNTSNSYSDNIISITIIIILTTLTYMILYITWSNILVEE